MKYQLLILSLVIMASCANEPEKQSSDVSGSTVHASTADTIVTNQQPRSLEGCYEMVMKQDSAMLFLDVIDSTVNGNLVYDWAEKDRNSGSIKGVIRKDMIHADYVFQSEGVTSVREVVFKIQDTMLLQGFGDLKEVNGKVVFTDPDRLQFNTDHPFIKIACKQEP